MKHLKNQKGAALVITILVLMVVSIVGVAMMFSVSNEIRVNKTIEERAIAKYLAQAGIDHALYLVEKDTGTMVYPYSTEIVLGDPTRVYQMNISKNGGVIVINSIGKLEKDGVIKRQVSLQATLGEDGTVVVK